MRRLQRLLEAGLGALGVALLGLLALLIVVGVSARKLGRPIGWYDEVAGVLLAWLTWYGAALAALKRAHLGMPDLVALARPELKVPLVLLRAAIVCGTMALIGWFGWQVVEVLGEERLVTVPWLSVGVTQSAIPIAAAVFVLAELLTLPERLAEARAGRSAHRSEPAGAGGPP